MAIGALIQEPLTSIMSLGRRAVTRVSQLEGKTVGTAGIPYQDAYLKTILEEAGVDEGSVKTVDVGFQLTQAMTSKRVDATLGAFWNIEGIQLQRDRKRPEIIKVDRAGVPTYNELVLVARAEDLRDRGALFRSFLQALAQGHQTVRKDPAAGVDALLRGRALARPRRHARAGARDAPGLLPARPRAPVRLHGPAPLEGLRRVDAGERPDQAARVAAGADQRVPAGRGALRKYVPARPAHGA